MLEQKSPGLVTNDHLPQVGPWLVAITELVIVAPATRRTRVQCLVDRLQQTAEVGLNHLEGGQWFRTGHDQRKRLHIAMFLS